MKKELTQAIITNLPNLKPIVDSGSATIDIKHMVDIYNDYHADGVTRKRENVGCRPCIKRVYDYFASMSENINLLSWDEAIRICVAGKQMICPSWGSYWRPDLNSMDSFTKHDKSRADWQVIDVPNFNL